MGVKVKKDLEMFGNMEKNFNKEINTLKGTKQRFRGKKSANQIKTRVDSISN